MSDYKDIETVNEEQRWKRTTISETKRTRGERMKAGRYRIYYLLLMLILIFCSFTGCSSGLSEKRERAANTIERSSNTLQKGKIHIQYAQLSVPSAKIIEDAINRFNETNTDNIYVDVLKIARGQYMETLNMLLASGKGPDVFEVTDEWLNSYIYKGWTANLSSFIDDNFLKAFPEWAVNFAQNPLFKNNFYTIPSNQITYRLIYNKDLFRKAGLDPATPPKTLSELERYAQTISDVEKGERKYGFALPMSEEWMDFVLPMESTNAYSGVYYYNFKQGRYDLSVYKPWFMTLKKMKENGVVFPGMNSMKAELATVQFAGGNIGMMYAASWEPSLLFEQFSPNGEWGVAMPPAIDESSAGRGAVAISIAGLNAVNSATDHFNESVKVWKYLYSKDYLGHLFKSGSIIPTVNGIMGNPDYKPIVFNFSDFFPGSHDSIYPDTPLLLDEWMRAQAYVAAITGDQTIDKVLLEESNKLNTILDNGISAYNYNNKYYNNPNVDSENPVKK